MALHSLQKCRYLSRLIQNYRKINCNQFTTSVINLTPRFSNNYPNLNSNQIKIKNKTENNNDNELKTLEEIENTLFGNVQHKPVNTNKLLTEFRSEEKQLKSDSKFEQKKIATTVKNHDDDDDDDKLIYDSQLEIHFKKLKLNDPLLGKLFIAARGKKNKSQNHHQNLIVAEGWRLIYEALMCGLKLESLIFSKKDVLEPILSILKKQKSNNKGKIYKVPQQTLRTWSTLTTCPGLIAIFDRTNINDLINLNKFNVDDFVADDHNENVKLKKLKQIIYPITVICDNIREPNNLGSIIRTCAAVPCSQVIIMKGCCDPWETKALRGGCGGQFRINIKDDIKWENLNDYLPDTNDLSVFIAENNLNKTIIDYPPIREYTDIMVSKQHNCVVIGGETEGISENAYKFMKYRATNINCINIPLADGIDSLNTSSALTLILFEMRKHLKSLSAPLKTDNNDHDDDKEIVEEQVTNYQQSSNA